MNKDSKNNYEPLSDENSIFLKERGLKLSEVAKMIDMKPQTLRMSTAKNKYIKLLRAFCERIGV